MLLFCLVLGLLSGTTLAGPGEGTRQTGEGPGEHMPGEGTRQAGEGPGEHMPGEGTRQPGEGTRQPGPIIKGRFECGSGQFHYPTDLDTEVCNGELKLILRNRDKDHSFTGATDGVEIVYGKDCSVKKQNTSDQDSSEFVVKEQLVLLEIQPDDMAEVQISLPPPPRGQQVSCEPGCIKAVIRKNSKTFALAKKEVLPDHAQCQNEKGGNIKLTVQPADDGMIIPQEDDKGNYFVELKDFITMISLEGTLKEKLNGEGQPMPYRTLAFFKAPGNRELGWPVDCPHNRAITPEAALGDVTVWEFYTNSSDGKVKLYPGKHEPRVYITGPKASCSNAVCGVSQLVVYFDWMHHLDRYPDFDQDKCDNFYTRNVAIDCSNIPKDVMEKTRVVEVVPDVMHSGDRAYVMSCYRKQVQLDVFHARKNTWQKKTLMAQLSKDPRVKSPSIRELVQLKRIELLLKGISKRTKARKEAMEQDDRDEAELQANNAEKEECKKKVLSIRTGLKDCDQSDDCSGEKCCSTIKAWLKEVIADCPGASVGRQRKETQDAHGKEEERGFDKPSKKDCPSEASFEEEQDGDEFEEMEAMDVVDSIEEGLNTKFNRCVQYPEDPMVVAQRRLTQKLGTPWKIFFNADLDRMMNLEMQNKSRQGHLKKGASSSSLDYLKHCDVNDMKQSPPRDQQYFAVFDSGIWRTQKLRFLEKPYCWRKVAVIRCPACENRVMCHMLE